MAGDYRGDGPQRLEVRLLRPLNKATATVTINGQSVGAATEGDMLLVPLPAATDQPCHFEVQLLPASP